MAAMRGACGYVAGCNVAHRAATSEVTKKIRVAGQILQWPKTTRRSQEACTRHQLCQANSVSRHCNWIGLASSTPPLFWASYAHKLLLFPRPRPALLRANLPASAQLVADERARLAHSTDKCWFAQSQRLKSPRGLHCGSSGTKEVPSKPPGRRRGAAPACRQASSTAHHHW